MDLMTRASELHPEALELAELLRPAWPAMTARLRASGVPLNDGDDVVTIESLDAEISAVKGRMIEINNEFRGLVFTEEANTEFSDLDEKLKERQRLRKHLQAREDRVRSLMDEPGSREEGAGFHTPSTRKGDEPWDYSHIRGATSLEGQRQMLRDQALRCIEHVRFEQPRTGIYRSQTPGRSGIADAPNVRNEDAQAHLERLLTRDTRDGELAYRILNTANPVYIRAWGKAMFGAPLTPEETRALSLTNTGGGFAVPFTLDPTIIPTSNLAVNPYRRIGRQIQIVGTTWQGITSAGVSVSRVAEGTEAGDNAPTIAQPSVTPQRVQGFVPFSIEIGADWSGQGAEIARMLAEAKDTEEATSYTTGTGTPPAAQGIITGATTTVTATGVASFAVGDLYKTEEALPPRFQPGAEWIGARFIYNKARQFDTAGGASIWIPTLRDGLNTDLGPDGRGGGGGNMGARLLDYPANEVSTMAAALTTGSKILVLGDFSYFAIVDRVGMDIELVPHLFGAANRRPTGQRGWFAMWRNDSRVLDPAAFRVLTTG